MERITSRSNPLCLHIRKLNSSGAYRREKGEFVGEGPKLLEEALRAGAEITAVVSREGVQVECPPHIRRIEVPGTLLESLCDTKTPQGVLFLCRLPRTPLPERLEGSRYLVLDGVQDPGNVGTVWRTADAFGVDGLILAEGCADPFAPKTVRATMGAVFRLPVYLTSIDALQKACKEADLPLYATALQKNTVGLAEVDLRRCVAVIGSEGRGVSPEMLALCEKTLKIPMRERCESLNAAVAAAVVLWEGWRQSGRVF